MGFGGSKKEKTNKVFSLLIISILLWITLYHFASLSDNKDLSLVLFRISGSSVFLFFIFYYYFIILFTRENKFYEQLGKLIIIYGLLFSFFTIFTDLIIKNSIVESWGIYPEFSSFGRLTFYGYVILLTLLINKILVTKYSISTKVEKLKIQYFITGFIIFAVLNFIFDVLLPVFFNNYKFSWAWNYSTIFLIAFTAYAIFKHELMGVKVLLIQVLVSFISIILLADILFLTNNLIMQLLKAGILITFLYFSLELIKGIKKEREARRELETAYDKIKQYTLELEKVNKNLTEKYEDLDALLSLSQTSSSGSGIKKGIQNILNILPTKFGYTKIIGAALLRCDEKSNSVYAYITTESILLKKGVSLLPKPALTDYALVVSEENRHNLTIEAILSNKIQKSEKLTDFASPPVEKHIAQLMQKAMGIKSVVTIPLNVRGVKLGALMLMFSKPLREITQRDMDLITAFSQQVGVMLENLQYYETLNKNIEELTRTKNNLEEILTMKNDFLHIVSHQLRTPLTAVRGLISMWHDGDFDHYTADKMKGIKDRVLANADRLNNIINDMLVAMESEGELKLVFDSVDVEKMIREVVEMFKANYERRGLYIKFDKIEKGIPIIEADPRNLFHVFMNIVDNAEKYTQKGGLDITLKRENDNISVKFTDTGVGISEEDKERLFKKFSRGKKSNNFNPNGSGLGLFIAKQILDEHHGKIQASSLGEGKGSTFVILLPIKQPISAEVSKLDLAKTGVSKQGNSQNNESPEPQSYLLKKRKRGII
ncbi:sensor histidine kinase [Candidatus Methanoperedens nitratireducens]|uniref:histidine kinase n=1 Tax=Candidatus Methanoperedens nitratireducens TaxID=1392998 RepID=A0A284VPW1_9EURY|nr:HAMP domain-containing sensor histidine kinase [Candidatus Methanoperedens nitroreducens]SNQ61217.1 putative Histidine kinase [Candidatus Methanoperedens nitroreducens]